MHYHWMNMEFSVYVIIRISPDMKWLIQLIFKSVLQLIPYYAHPDQAVVLDFISQFTLVSLCKPSWSPSKSLIP